MLCLRNVDLPDNVLKRLPQPARDVYREAFYSACENYRGSAKPGGGRSLKDVAHGVALASLEGSFHKTSRGRWVPD